jgi:hypothetical protein
MLDLIIGPSYEDVYSIDRVLLADQSEHLVLFLVDFSKIMAGLSKSWIAYWQYTSTNQIPVRKMIT